MRRSNPILLLIFLVLLATATLAGLTWMNYQFSKSNPGGNDFLARWMGAHMWLTQGVSPYDDRVSLATQEIIYGHPANVAQGEDKNHFVYPLYSILFFGPFGLMEYTLARALWMTVLEVCLIILTILSIRLVKFRVRTGGLIIWILFGVFWYVGVRTIVLGQFAGINALLIVAGIALIYYGRDLEGGLVLALSTSKPQMSFLIIPFVLLWALSRGRMRVWVGVLGGFSGLMAASLLFMPDWPLQFIRQLMDYPSYTSRIGSTLSIVADFFPGIWTPLNWLLHGGFALYLLIEWIVTLKKDENWFLFGALVTLVVTNLVAMRTATPHYAALLPAIFFIFRVWKDRWGKIGTGMMVAAAVLLFAGQWGLFFGTLIGNLESPWMYLPVPFFCLIGLWWVRWWALNPPKLFFDSLGDLE